MSDVVAEIAAERKRQIEGEGWTTIHDDQHLHGELAYAAGCYAIFGAGSGYILRSLTPTYWPWSSDWWKPRDRRRDLIKAAALLVAEIERLDRKETPDA